MQRLWTPETLTLACLLAISVPLAAAFTDKAFPLLPSTALVTVAFWHFGRRKPRRSLIGYCLGAGALAGIVNAWVTLLLSGIFLYQDWIDLPIYFYAAPIAAIIGVVHGLAFLVPLRILRSDRSFRLAESIDRCLITNGAWGLFILCLGLSFCITLRDPSFTRFELVWTLGLPSLGLHALMLCVGLVRWAHRRLWLGRVAAGKIAGWRVCENQQFHAAQLEGLEIFGQPLFRTSDADALRVLVHEESSGSADTYRSPSPPKFLIV